MIAAASLPAETAGAFVEGWRIGRQAARLIVHGMQAEATKPAARDALAAAVQRIDALRAPPPSVALPRADRLEASIRAALAVAAVEGLGPEAITILQEAVR